MSNSKNVTGIPKYYDFGIDLGTTNSCIAKAEDNNIRIYQTRENINTTRSAVYINKNGKKFVGMKAYAAQTNDKDNVALGFKRLMGTSDKKHFPSSDLFLSPIELSAEVLKSLKSDVKRLSDEDVRNVVITVPAAFGTLQSEATYQSAKLAGFEQVHLLQEPIAAAIAYGASSSKDSNNWMVYDFGGGTFDVAIVSTKNNRLTVLNNEGNNLLGGKDIDNLIMDKIFLPVLKDNYSLFPASTDEYQKLYTKLQLLAEETKVELSSLDETTVCFDSNMLGQDAKGREIDFEFEVKQEDFEKHLEDVINETISLAKTALEGADLSINELDNIVLVGGSTQIPLVRKKLRETFDCKLILAKDPISIVAKGAAIYASVTEVAQKSEDIQPGREAITVNMQYDPVTSKSNTTVSGRIYGDEEISEIRIESTDGVWDSGWFELLDADHKYFESEVMLQNNKTNLFNLRCRDKRGNEVEASGSNFAIKHKEDHLEVARPLVTSSLCIEYIDNQGNKKLEPIIKKNTPLPAYENYTFNTNKDLKRGQVGNPIAIKLWEGEDFDEPDANVWIANIYIQGSDLKRPLLKGTEVAVSVNIDESRRITMGIKVPSHNLEIAHEQFYKPKPINIEEHFMSIRNDIESFYERLDYIDSKISRTDEEAREGFCALNEEIDRFNTEYENEYDVAIYDKDKALKLIEGSKKMRKSFSALEKKLFLEKQNYSIEKEAVDTIDRVDYTINTFGDDKDKRDMNILKNEIQEAIEFDDPRGVSHGIKKMVDSEMKILIQRYDYWVHIFLYLSSGEVRFIDQNQADEWIMAGQKAVGSESFKELQEAVYALIQLTEKSMEQIVQESIIDPGLNK